MTLDEVVAKVQSDKDFAREIRNSIRNACNEGPGTGEWETLEAYFAGDEEQLARLQKCGEEFKEHGNKKTQIMSFAHTCDTGQIICE